MGDQIGSILGGGPSCAGDERDVVLSTERMQGLAQLRRGLRVCLDWGRGEIPPVDRVLLLPGIDEEIRAHVDRGRCVGRDLVGLADDGENSLEA